MLRNAEQQTRRLTYAADRLLAESWRTRSYAETEGALNSTLTEVEYKFKDLPVNELDQEANSKLTKVGVTNRFHWPLEFPEVFEGGGFHSIIGNPPFMGGQKITGNLGDEYREYLVNQLGGGQRGSADLVTYFFFTCGLVIANWWPFWIDIYQHDRPGRYS